MPKAKTHSSLSKRTKVTASGKIKTAKAGRRHLLQNKSSKSKGRDKYGHVMSPAETGKIKKALKI